MLGATFDYIRRLTTSHDNQDLAQARQFLHATLPLIILEVLHRVPVEGNSNDASRLANAHKGAMFETWSLSVARHLSHQLVSFGLAELCFDHRGLQACRLIVPLEGMKELVDACDGAVLVKTLPAYCTNFHDYVYDFFRHEQVSRNAIVLTSYEVDLITECYCLAACETYSKWAVNFASQMEESLSKAGSAFPVYRIGANT